MKSTNIISLLVLCLLLLVISSPVLAAEAKYTLYESELTRLTQIISESEANYNQVKSSLQTSKQQLAQQEKQLQTLREQLEMLKNQIEKLETQSTTLSEKLNQAETDLTTLEKSFLAYKNEAEAKIKRLTIQRNVCAVIMAIVAFL